MEVTERKKESNKDKIQRAKKQKDTQKIWGKEQMNGMRISKKRSFFFSFLFIRVRITVVNVKNLIKLIFF